MPILQGVVSLAPYVPLYRWCAVMLRGDKVATVFFRGHYGAFLSLLLTKGDRVEVSYKVEGTGLSQRFIGQGLGFQEPQPLNKAQRIEFAELGVSDLLREAEVQRLLSKRANKGSAVA